MVANYLKITKRNDAKGRAKSGYVLEGMRHISHVASSNDVLELSLMCTFLFLCLLCTCPLAYNTIDPEHLDVESFVLSNKHKSVPRIRIIRLISPKTNPSFVEKSTRLRLLCTIHYSSHLYLSNMAALEINAQEPVVKTKYELTGRSLGNGLQDLVVSARGGFGGQKLEAGMNNLVGSAKENYTDFKNLAHDAVSSKAYLYPFKVNVFPCF